MNNQRYNQEGTGIAMNIFAVLGFVAILIAGLWATIQLVKQVSRLSFEFGKANIILSSFSEDDILKIVEKDIETRAGENVVIKWDINKGKFSGSENTEFTFTYVCNPGIYLKMKENEDPVSYKAIPCNSPIRLNAEDKELDIMPVIQNDYKERTVTYSLSYNKEDAGDTYEAIGTIIVQRPTVAKEDVNGSPKQERARVFDAVDSGSLTQNYSLEKVAGDKYVRRNYSKKSDAVKSKKVSRPNNVRYSNPNGMPDLAVKILNVEYLTDDKLSVRFEVFNKGTKVASAWTFTAELPTDPSYTYVSEAQPDLYAGERAEMMLVFDRAKSGRVTITVDKSDDIKESLESNNFHYAEIARKK